MLSPELLASAVSSIIGQRVTASVNPTTRDCHSGTSALDLVTFHELSLVKSQSDVVKGSNVAQKNPDIEEPGLIQEHGSTSSTSFLIFAKQVTGRTDNLRIDSSYTVEQLENYIHALGGPRPGECSLIFAGRKLYRGHKLSDYGISREHTIHVTLYLRGGSVPLLVDARFLAPEWNFDFTNVKSNRTVYTRGGHVYRRPDGWMRFGLNVIDKWEDKAWLGSCNGFGEWPVSYHGTGYNNAMSIAKGGFDSSKGKRFAYGRGIYSTPNVGMAEKYARIFVHNNAKYQVIIQNRVNPVGLRKVNVGWWFEAWISSNDADLRPYGILVKKIEEEEDDCE